MLPETNRPSTLTVFVAVAVLLSGCSALTGPLDEGTERAVIDDVAQRFENIDGYTATQEITSSLNGSESTMRAKVWIRPDTGQSRSEPLEPPARTGDVTVVGKETLWSYDASEETVTRTKTSVNLGDRQLDSRLDEIVERFDIVYRGETSLDGRTVHELTLTPNASVDTPTLGANVTMWVDDEKRFPTKIDYEFSDSSVTIRYENLTINPGLSDDRFTFDAPDDATVRSPAETSTRTFDTRQALAAATNRSVPDPTIPDDFTFQQGMVIEGQNTAVALDYENASRRIAVTSTATPAQFSGDGETVTIDGTEGTYRSVGDTGTVRWTCDDRTRMVSGDVGRDGLIAVAASIGCH